MLAAQIIVSMCAIASEHCVVCPHISAEDRQLLQITMLGWTLIATPRTLYYLHARSIISELWKGHVLCAEIEGWHNLDGEEPFGARGGAALLDCLCRKHLVTDIRRPGYMKLTFLEGIDNRELLAG